MEDSESRYNIFKSKLTEDILAQKSIDTIITEMQTSTTKPPDPPNNILPNIGVLDRVIESSAKYNQDIIKKAKYLKIITLSFITIVKESYESCKSRQASSINVCLPETIKIKDGEKLYMEIDTKRNELKLRIEESRKSAAPTATAAPTASVFPPPPIAVSESLAPNSNPMVVKSTTADAIAALDEIAKSPQQQQEQQQVTITDTMGVKEQRLQEEKNDDPSSSVFAPGIGNALEMNQNEPVNIPRDSPPPPPPPPKYDDDDEGEMENTEASPSEDDTCGGIENLCFLSNTISRLKFDCVSSLQIMSALNLANLNLNDMTYLEYKSAIDSVPNYENIMDDEDELLQQIAYENSKNTDGNVEGDTTFDPVTGDSPNTIAARNTEIYGGYCLQADLLPLLQFTETVRNDAKNNCKLHKILTDMRDIMKCAFGIPEDEFHMKPHFSYIRLYDNIDLVELDTKSLFPKFSFNILSVKNDMLLQTRLLAGRENGMGFFLNDYVGSALQPYFDSIISSGFAKVKIIPPADTSHLWQIKLRVLKTDFIFISLQIINVKQEYFQNPFDRGGFMVDEIYNKVYTSTTEYESDMEEAPAIIDQRIREDYNKALNLCFSLYNKCLSKDFNALCSLSELDGIIAVMLFMNDPKSCEIFTEYIKYFLTNLVDTYVNVKKQYFYLGLYNLLVSISQKIYTPETKAYEKLFDSNAATNSKPGKNIFFDSMHIIKEAVIKANAPCSTNRPSSTMGAMGADESVETKMREPIRFAMGGGKLYSLYQKALSITPQLSNSHTPPPIFTDPSTTSLLSSFTLVQILYNFQNNLFIQQYLQSRDKENIQLREKINQLFLLKIQEKSLMDSGIPNEFLSEMITILGIELKNQKIFSDLKKKLTELSSANPTDYAFKIQIILELSTVLPVLPIIDDINRPLYDYVTITFLKFFIDYDINFIKYLLLNFESIHFHHKYNLLVASMSETVNPAADADFGMFYEDTALGATSCMTVCMILQLALKDLIDVNVIRSLIDPWTNSEIDIGNSCIGTPPVTLSSLRIVINNSVPFYKDILPETGSPYPGCITSILTGLKLAELINVKATISPFDFVQKGSLVAYIEHILEAVNTFGMLYTYKRGEKNIKINITPISSEDIELIAQKLSNYCMITDECCSTPLKGIFDIFYTLFIIENFANRALVTQKINKELKRVAICAKVLFLHYKLLDPSSHNIEIQDMLDILLEMCSFSFSEPDFSLNNESQMIYIMNKYVEFVNMIANFALQSLPFLFFCSLPKFEQTRGFTKIEDIFNKLLENSSNRYYNVNPNTEVTSKLTECIPCVLDVLNKCQPSILQMLNNNKQYCAECDAMNKASGRIILSSAYQSVLWSTKNYKTISKTRPSRDVLGLYDLYEKATASTDNTFNNFIKELITMLGNCTFTRALALQETLISILKLDDIDPSGEIIAPRNASPYFQFLCWFLTCVFGVKVKSKKQKIASLTRKYLSLIDKQLTDLFGFTINITEETKNLLKSPTDTPTGSPTGSPSCRGMNKGQIPPYYLFLAYDSFVAPMAYDKYDDYAKNHPKKDPYPSEINRFGVSCDVILYDGGIAIDPYTPVMDFILTDLSGRFEKLPAGISKIIAVSEKMRGVLLNFLSSYQNPESVQKYLCSLSQDSFADILYVPGSHDARKFFELKPEERTPWLRYLIYKIRISENVIDDVTDKPNPKDRFFCIKLLFLLIKYLILPDISSGKPCDEILTVLLLSGLPPLDIPFLTTKINNYYDKCGQIERQQKVNALNADRKGITLSAVCVVPKKKSDASNVSEQIVQKITSAIDAAKAKAKEETKETKESVKSSSTKKSRSSGESASSEPEKSSLTLEQQQKLDAAIETQAVAGVVSQLLQNLVSKPTKTQKDKSKVPKNISATPVVQVESVPKKPLKAKRLLLPQPPQVTSTQALFGAQFGTPPAVAQSSVFAPAPVGATSQPFVAAPPFFSLPQAQFPPQPQLQLGTPPAAQSSVSETASFRSPSVSPFTPAAAPFQPQPQQTLYVEKRRIKDDDGDQIGIFTGNAYVNGKEEKDVYPVNGTMVYYDDNDDDDNKNPSQKYEGEFNINKHKHGSGVTTYYDDPKKQSLYQGTYIDGKQYNGLLTYMDGTNVEIKDGKHISSPVSNTAPQPPTPLPEQQNVKAKQVFKKASLADQQEGDKKTKLGATKREKREEYSVDLRDVNTRGSKRQTNYRDTPEGGSPTLSIPTPSKTRKSHQRKRSHSSNKSTFKRRKYTEE